jgi:hypothetical protein
MRPTSCPSITTEPEVTVSSPAMQCINVDLPDPDGPMIAVSSPRAKSTSTPASARTAVGPVPYSLTRPRAEAITGDSPPAASAARPVAWAVLSRRVLLCVVMLVLSDQQRCATWCRNEHLEEPARSASGMALNRP